MLDTVIGPVTNVFSAVSFQMNVTHIGRHNKFRYNTYENIFIESNQTRYTLNQLHFSRRRIKCHIKFRDAYSRLHADIYLE